MSEFSCVIKTSSGQEISLGDVFWGAVAYDSFKNVQLLKRAFTYNHAELAAYRVRKLTVFSINVHWDGKYGEYQGPKPTHTLTMTLVMTVDMSDNPAERKERPLEINVDRDLYSLFTSKEEAQADLNDRIGSAITVSELARIAEINSAMLEDPNVIEKITDGNMTFAEYKHQLGECSNTSEVYLNLLDKIAASVISPTYMRRYPGDVIFGDPELWERIVNDIIAEFKKKG